MWLCRESVRVTLLSLKYYIFLSNWKYFYQLCHFFAVNVDYTLLWRVNKFYSDITDSHVFSSLQACVSVQLPSSVGGVGGEAVFVDTEGSFTVGRLKGKVSELSIIPLKMGGWISNIIIINYQENILFLGM